MSPCWSKAQISVITINSKSDQTAVESDFPLARANLLREFLAAWNVDTIVLLFLVAYVVLPHMG